MIVKDIREMSEKERNSIAVTGKDYALIEAEKDRDQFMSFINCEFDPASDEEALSVRILSILKKLGYPMDELGTYFCKDIISAIYYRLLEVENIYDPIQIKWILLEIKLKYSQFYFNLARNDKDFGIKSFHSEISETIKKIDEKSLDKEQSLEIFGEKARDVDYATEAFLIASYIQGTHCFDKAKRYTPHTVYSLKQ